MAKMLDGVDLNGQRATNAATPTAPSHLTTKAYVDAALATASPNVTVTVSATAPANPLTGDVWVNLTGG